MKLLLKLINTRKNKNNYNYNIIYKHDIIIKKIFKGINKRKYYYLKRKLFCNKLNNSFRIKNDIIKIKIKDLLNKDKEVQNILISQSKPLINKMKDLEVNLIR